MQRSRLVLLIGIIAAFELTGCDFNLLPEVMPTLQEIPITATPSITETVIPSPTMTANFIQLETSTPTFTPPPPTPIPTPTITPGPYEHTIKAGETLGYIIQLYGYTDLRTGPGSIIDQIVALNPNIPNADTLPGAGNQILIPRQTATPTPQNTETAVAVIATNAASSPVVTLPGNTGIEDYVVQQGETFVGIAQEHNTTIEVLAVLNPEVNIFGCNFEIPSGGPNCNPPLQIGQVLKVPAPTPTPTLSPTPSGSETPTPTPTYTAPLLVYPPEGALAPPGIFSVQWVGVGILQPNEVYLVEVVDVTSGMMWRGVTRDTSLLLPETLIPQDGQAHTFNWTVRVAVPNEQGVYRPIGAPPVIRSFRWESR